MNNTKSKAREMRNIIKLGCIKQSQAEVNTMLTLNELLKNYSNLTNSYEDIKNNKLGCFVKVGMLANELIKYTPTKEQTKTQLEVFAETMQYLLTLISMNKYKAECLNVTFDDILKKELELFNPFEYDFTEHFYTLFTLLQCEWYLPALARLLVIGHLACFSITQMQECIIMQQE